MLLDFEVNYRFANGIEWKYHTGRQYFTIEGTEGKVEVNRGYLKTWPDNLKDRKIGSDEIHLYESKNHYTDWLDAIRGRTKPICDIETGASSVIVCHLGNLAYKLQRPLKWDPDHAAFIGDDEANRMLSRPMRSPWHI